MKLPSPRIDPASERTSPPKTISLSSSVPRLAASCSATRPGRFSRSIANDPRLKVPTGAGQTARPFWGGAETERHAVAGILGPPPLAAHQRAEAELNLQLVGA